MERKQTISSLPLAVVALVAAGFALIQMKTILLPFVTAFFLASLAGPFVAYLKRFKVRTGPAIVLIILLTGCIIFLLGKVFYSQVPVFQEEYSSYRLRFLEIVGSLEASLPEQVKEVVAVDWNTLLPETEEIIQFVGATLGTLFSLLGTLFLILLYMVFLLIERDVILYRVKKAWPGDAGGRILDMIDNIQKQTESYIVGKTIISLLTGFFVSLLLWIFGVKFFFIWGLLTFLLNFIPNIGSCIATLFPLLMAAVQPEPTFSAVKIGILAACLVVIQFAVGSVLEPRLLGNRLRLSPLVIFLSFILWGWFWGLPGMILSIPIMATIKIVFENTDSLKPLAIVISNENPSARSDPR